MSLLGCDDMKFFKKNRTLTLILLIIIAVVLAIFIFRDTINFDESTAVYGNRLEGIEKVKVTSDQEKKIKDVLKDKSSNVTVTPVFVLTGNTAESNDIFPVNNAGCANPGV